MSRFLDQRSAITIAVLVTTAVLIAALMMCVRPLAAQSAAQPPLGAVDLCTLLGPPETQPFVGPAVGTSTTGLSLCNWNKPQSKDTLGLQVTQPKGPNDQLKLLRSLTEMRKGAVVNDEPGIGDHAFSLCIRRNLTTRVREPTSNSPRVRLVILGYSGGKPGAEQMRDVLRVAAKKVAAAL